MKSNIENTQETESIRIAYENADSKLRECEDKLGQFNPNKPEALFSEKHEDAHREYERAFEQWEKALRSYFFPYSTALALPWKESDRDGISIFDKKRNAVRRQLTLEAEILHFPENCTPEMEELMFRQLQRSLHSYRSLKNFLEDHPYMSRNVDIQSRLQDREQAAHRDFLTMFTTLRKTPVSMDFEQAIGIYSQAEKLEFKLEIQEWKEGKRSSYDDRLFRCLKRIFNADASEPKNEGFLGINAKEGKVSDVGTQRTKPVVDN